MKLSSSTRTSVPEAFTGTFHEEMDSTMDDIYACALLGVLGANPYLLEKILSRSCNPKEAFLRMGGEFLPSRPDLRGERADILVRSEFSVLFSPSSFSSPSHIFLRRDSLSYPHTLRECPDSPFGVFIRSNARCSRFFSRRNYLLAVSVPSRLTPYGRECLESAMESISRLSRECEGRLIVVSGLEDGAEGDIQGMAMRERIPSVAVTGRPDGSLPSQASRGLCEHLSDSYSHCLLTDIPFFCSPEKDRRRLMERRDRIIAGLSDGVLVIEASRGFQTRLARYSFDYGRSVFALPGRVFDPMSEGCNILIRDNIAQALSSPDELPMWLNPALDCRFEGRAI